MKISFLEVPKIRSLIISIISFEDEPAQRTKLKPCFKNTSSFFLRVIENGSVVKANTYLFFIYEISKPQLSTKYEALVS